MALRPAANQNLPSGGDWSANADHNEDATLSKENREFSGDSCQIEVTQST
jgi:hypothetical protein